MILIMKLRNIENVLVGQNLGYYFYFKPTLLILIGFLITKLNFKKFAHLFLTSFLVLTTINSLIFLRDIILIKIIQKRFSINLQQKYGV